MLDILGLRGEEMPLWPTDKVVGEIFICRRFQEGRGRGVDELSNAPLAWLWWGHKDRYGSKRFARPGNFVEFLFGAFGFSLACIMWAFL